MAEENIYERVYKNGHKTFLTPEHEFMKHMVKKETLVRKQFQQKLAERKLMKPRNTLEGQVLKYEQNDQVLAPNYRPPNARCSTAPLNGSSTPGQKSSGRYGRCIQGIGNVDALRARKQDIILEMDHLKKIMEHKKLCLAAGGYGGYGKLLETLHPALQQKTAAIEDDRLI